MIKLIDRGDLNIVSSLLYEFLSETSYSNHTNDIDMQHLKRLAFSIIQIGWGWLYIVDGVPVGMLLAVKEANVWIPTKSSLRELVWYVKQDYRGTVGAGKLFVKYCSTAEKLLSAGEIDGYFTTRMGTTTDYDLESRGFRLTEKLYLKD